jgi:hypothetical protein
MPDRPRRLKSNDENLKSVNLRSSRNIWTFSGKGILYLSSLRLIVGIQLNFMKVLTFFKAFSISIQQSMLCSLPQPSVVFWIFIYSYLLLIFLKLLSTWDNLNLLDFMTSLALLLRLLLIYLNSFLSVFSNWNYLSSVLLCYERKQRFSCFQKATLPVVATTGPYSFSVMFPKYLNSLLMTTFRIT